MNGLNPFLQVVVLDGLKEFHQIIMKASIILEVIVVVFNPVSNGIQNPTAVMAGAAWCTLNAQVIVEQPLPRNMRKISSFVITLYYS